MMHDHRTTEEHKAISEIIPWFVNGTVGELERQRVDAHLRTCAVCRDDLLQEQRVYQQMAAERSIEYMPAASLKRLQARLDGLAAAAAPVDAPPLERRAGRSMPWQRRIAASIAVVAVALTLLTVNQWVPVRAREFPPAYHTVTTSYAHARDEAIRAVFSPSITLVELQAILDEAQLRIIAGPTEAGVYSLAANSERPVSSSLAMLRRHAAVRFAESTEPSVKSGRSGEVP
jgi:hypothetical protein